MSKPVTEYTLEEQQEQAKKYLCKGVRVHRFRKRKTKPHNRILYGLMVVENITTAELAKTINKSSRTVLSWIDGKLPTKEDREKLSSIFNCPASILFREAEETSKNTGR